MDLCTGVIVDQYSDAISLRKVLKSVADSAIESAGILDKGQIYQVIRPLSDPHVIFCVQRVAVLQSFQLAESSTRPASPTIEDFYSCDESDTSSDIAKTPANASDVQLQNISLKRKTVRRNTSSKKSKLTTPRDRKTNQKDAYAHISSDGVEGEIKQLLVAYDNGELQGSLWGAVWTSLKKLGWTNEHMSGKYLEAAAFIPVWAQDRYAEDKKCGNAVKTLVKNRDYFVYGDDALHYLRKHGLVEVTSEPSPSPDSRAVRRLRSVVAPVVEVPRKSPVVHLKKNIGKTRLRTPEMSRRYSSSEDSDIKPVYADNYAHLSDDGVEGEVKQLLMEFDVGLINTGPVWKKLTELGWSNENMHSKYMEATAYIPSWAQERFLEDKKCGNTKTLRKNRDYFVKPEDALRYLRKHGLKEVAEASPSPNGRAVRRFRSNLPTSTVEHVAPVDVHQSKKAVNSSKKKLKSERASTIIDPYAHIPNDGVEGEIKQLLVAYDNGELQGSLWGAVWTSLKKLGWTNEHMSGKYLESAAFIPVWAQDRYAEDKKCGNAVKTLVKNRDYFVYGDDALHYLRKHGLVEVTSEPSPSPDSRAVRRLRSVADAQQPQDQHNPSKVTTVAPKESGLKRKRPAKKAEEDFSSSDDDMEIDLSAYAHLSDTGAEGEIKQLLIDHDRSNRSGYYWSLIWKKLTELGWSNENMHSKYMEATAHIPSWSQERFLEDKKCGNTKTLRKNRDFFVKPEDALRYLRKHGLKEVAEASPSPNGRAARRSRSVPAPSASQHQANVGGSKKTEKRGTSKRMKVEESSNSEDESILEIMERRRSASKSDLGKHYRQVSRTASTINDEATSKASSSSISTHEEVVDVEKMEVDKPPRRKKSKAKAKVEVVDEQDEAVEELVMTQMDFTQGPVPELIKSFTAPAKDLLRAVWLGRPRLDLTNFSEVYKILKIHQWSYFYGEFNTVYFPPHAKGISKKKMGDYKEGVDYFVGSDAVLEFIKNQMRARGHDYNQMVDVAMFSAMGDTVLDHDFEDADDDDDLVAGVDEELHYRVPSGRVATCDRDAADFFHHVDENLIHSDNESIIDEDNCDDAEVSNFMYDLFSNAHSPEKNLININCNEYNDAMGICAADCELDTSGTDSSYSQPMETVEPPSSQLLPILSQEHTCVESSGSKVAFTKKTPNSSAKRISIVPGATLQRSSPSKSPIAALVQQRSTPSPIHRPVSHRYSSSSGCTTIASSLSTPLSARTRTDTSISSIATNSSSPALLTVTSPTKLNVVDVINMVRHHLQPGNEPARVLGRETEYARMDAAIRSAMRECRGSALSVCGLPGLGKTLSVKFLLRDIQQRESTTVRTAFLSATSCGNIYTEICKQIGVSTSDKSALTDLRATVCRQESRWFAVSSSPQAATVVVIDEFDRLSSTVANQLFELAMKPESRLILLALSNTLQLAQHFPNTIAFQPYTEEQLISVAASLTQGVFHDNALKMIVKSESARGDMRSLLNFCNLVMDKALEEYATPDTLASATLPIVQLKHVTRARADTGAKQCTVQESVAALPTLSRSLLTSLVLGFQMAQSFNVTEMHNTFNTYYQSELNISRLTSDEVENQASYLLNCGLLAMDNNKSINRNSPREVKYYFLKVEAEELVECNSLELIHRKNIERMLRETKMLL